MKPTLLTLALLCLSATPVDWPAIQCPGQPCNCLALHRPVNEAHEVVGCWLGKVAVWNNNGTGRCE